MKSMPCRMAAGLCYCLVAAPVQAEAIDDGSVPPVEVISFWEQPRFGDLDPERYRAGFTLARNGAVESATADELCRARVDVAGVFEALDELVPIDLARQFTGVSFSSTECSHFSRRVGSFRTSTGEQLLFAWPLDPDNDCAYGRPVPTWVRAFEEIALEVSKAVEERCWTRDAEEDEPDGAQTATSVEATGTDEAHRADRSRRPR